MFKIATWNVNSLRVRLSQLLDWLQVEQPQVMALQETKVTDPSFPRAEFEAIGYYPLFSGQKSYNGVALLSQMPGREVMTDLPDWSDDQRRILGATYAGIRVINVYVPNGASVDSDKYNYKLNWLEHFYQYIRANLITHPQMIILGDFNIALQDIDLYDPKAWQGKVIASPPERVALQKLLDLGLQDTFRLFEQPEKSFSWWDYRTHAFQRNLGVRIDLILASHVLKCQSCKIDRQPRTVERPSDHTPVIATFNVSF